MTTFASDIGTEYLVTDLVHELSSGLEIPFLLSSSPSECEDNQVRFDDIEYGRMKSDLWLEQDGFIHENYVKTEVESISEIDDLQTYSVDNNVFTSYFKTDSSGNGSGSDCSSTELCPVKNELDTPPVTPPDDRISPDNVLFLSSNELKFIPVFTKGCRKNKQVLNNLSRTVKIQPKPHLTAFDVSNQHGNGQTVVCNVFKDSQADGKSRSSNENVKDARSTVLSRKDLELLQVKRKQERMIRNRESAYLSRKRKKEYLAHLEKQVQELVDENNKLRRENYSLKERLMKYEDIGSLGTGTKSSFLESPKRTTALLALMLTVCLNIGSFSNFINGRTKSYNSGNLLEISNRVPFHLQNVRHTRSLLWSDPQFDDLTSSLTNVSKTSCLINQTESIRLESELRRWIRGDEDFTRPSKRNLSKTNNRYFNISSKITKSNNRSRRKSRVRRSQSTSKAEVDVFRMQAHFLNFDSFFEAIHRRDDTFYLVSFSADHLLLPALAHNKTSRPKMSLMLPAFLSNSTSGISSDHVEMMQIDCEVTNTQLLSVNENDIPSHMRPYSNTTSREKDSTVEDEKISRYLVDGLLGKKNSLRNSFRKNLQNFTSLNSVDAGNETDVQDFGSEDRKQNRYEYMNVVDEDHPSPLEKHNGSEPMSPNNYYDFFFNGKTGGDRELNNESYNVAEGEVQFLDSSRKNFLKTLIVPPTLSNQKTLSYKKKLYKSSIKSSFP